MNNKEEITQNKSKGFTLLETMIATTIILMAFTSAGMLIAAAVGLNDHLKNQTIAANYAQSHITNIINQVNGGLVIPASASGHELTNDKFSYAYTVDYADTSPVPPLPIATSVNYQPYAIIVVTMQWDDRFGSGQQLVQRQLIQLNQK